MNNEKELTIEQEVTKDCPVLFQMIDKPYTETTMCWGFECGKGWHNEIAKTCRLFEILNCEFYPKYRVRIQADQIKEKYGTLRFYYSIVQDPGKVRTFFGGIFKGIEHLLDKIDYKVKTVVDVEPYDYDDVNELSKEEYDKELESTKNGFKASNVEYLEKDGKYLKIYHIHNYGRNHIEPTKFKLFWNLRIFSRRIHSKLMYYNIIANSKTRNCMSFLDTIARREIDMLEKRCENICEKCGVQIGTSWSPKCETDGYIQYLCKSCYEELTGGIKQ